MLDTSHNSSAIDSSRSENGAHINKGVDESDSHTFLNILESLINPDLVRQFKESYKKLTAI